MGLCGEEEEKMIKVFLVEDEFAIREGIKRSVNWDANGFELVGEAGDGEVAFPKILKEKPDILLTDIRMPFMDGLELASLVRKELPQIKIIVLSGYDDFNYAKKAISIGVEEYMLKPVSGDDLINELRKVADAIQAERSEELVRQKYLRDREEIRILEQQKFLHDMINGKLSVQDSISQGRELGIDVTAPFYSVVLFQVFPSDRDNMEINEYSGVVEEIHSKIKERYSDKEHVYLYDQVGDVLCFLERSDSPEELRQNVISGIELIDSVMKDYKNDIYFISVGKAVERIRDVNISYKDASRKFAERYMHDRSYVFYGDDASDKEKIKEYIHMEKQNASSEMYVDINDLDISKVDTGVISQKAIYNFLKSGTLAETDDLIDDYFDSMGNEAIESMMLRQYVLVEALISAVTFLEGLGVSKEEATSLLGELSNPLSFVESAESARVYAKRLLKLLIEYRNKISDSRYSDIIDKAKTFIEENYKNEDMSLQLVASSVNVSSNHFSAVFRKETGKTFIDYLTMVRMNEAKNLLLCTPMKTSEIGFEVGYRDPHYFSYIFKKTQGMSPKEYRRSKKEP